MMRKMFMALFFFLLLPLFLNSQNYEVSVTTVNVWIKALDKSGQPVPGLTQSDFEVYEDNKKMVLTCFEEINSLTQGQQTGQAAQSAPNVPSATQPAIPPKKFVLFLDLLNTSEQEYINLKPKIDQFVDQVTKSGWSAMIAGLTPEAKLGVMLQFTNNASRLHTVIGSLQANAKRELRVIRNERELSDLYQSGGGKANDNTVSQMFRLARTYGVQDKQIAKFSLQAMESFANYLQSFNRAEHLVILFVSGGFTADPGRHYQEVVQRLTGMEGDATTMPEAVRETDFDLTNEVKKSIGRLNRADTTVYAVNTRGMNTYDPDRPRDDQYMLDYQDSLAQIAQETGGVAFQNSQNFQVGFDKIFGDLNNQYLLCYNAPEHKKPEEYHHIKVVVKKQNISLRHRQGYVG